MNLIETYYSAINALKLNKVRSFLTMLGVIIGVFAVVTLVSLVKGIENFVVDTFSSLGTNLIIVAPGRASFTQDPSISFTDNKLDPDQVDLIYEHAGDYIKAASPNIRISKTLRYKTGNFLSTIVGVNENGFDIVNLEIEDGRFIKKSDVDSSAKVIVIGHNVKKELFGTQDAVGNNIKLDGKSFEVIGTMTEKGLDSDERAIIPYTTALDVLDIPLISGFSIKAKDSNKIDQAMVAVELALLRELKPDEFTVISQKDILESVSNILNILSIGLGAIAAISLIVGGIGIMNIMLVSVTERTQEVGLRKAIGATPFNIGTQFMIESVIISFLGGFIGLGLGYLVTFGIRSFIRAEIPFWAILMGIGFSIVVGVVFGTYPALTAAKKDPIEALRYE
jgi:putative ABC transport system permease protein